MARVKVKAKVEAVEEVTVLISDLEEEFGLSGVQIRQIIRKQGFTAPKLDVKPGTFGPKAKYQWVEGSEELAAIRIALADAKPAKAKAKD